MKEALQFEYVVSMNCCPSSSCHCNTHPHTHTHTYTYIHTRTHTHTHAHTHTHTHIHTLTHTHTHARTHTCKQNSALARAQKLMLRGKKELSEEKFTLNKGHGEKSWDHFGPHLHRLLNKHTPLHLPGHGAHVAREIRAQIRLDHRLHIHTIRGRITHTARLI